MQNFVFNSAKLFRQKYLSQALVLNRNRSYLKNGNTENILTDIDKIAEVVDQSQNIVVMAGAGLSTASGIPDFRSPGTGIYDNLKKFNLPYPEAIFEIDYFKEHPGAFNTWAKEFFPGEHYFPNKAHYFIQVLQERAKLSKYYTQNIDGLERLAGVKEKNMVEAHGTFHSAACVLCKESHPIEEYKKSIYQDIIPTCKACQGFIKPNIVFFGEQLPTRFFDEAEIDCVFCDLLICIGTSLEVYPFAGLADLPKHFTRRLLINYDLVGSFGGRPNDAVLLGDIVKNVEALCDKLGWSEELLEAQIEHDLNLKK